MLIGAKQHTAGNVRRFSVNYEDWLEEGRTLNQSSGFSASNVTATVTDVVVGTVSTTAKKLYFWVSGGSINEVFTVQVQVTDTLGEVVIDTIQFSVVQP